MKKEKSVYIGLAFVIAVMLFLDGGFSFTEKTISRVYNLSELNLTQIDIKGEVYITRGGNEKLVVEAPKDIIDQLEIVQNNGILTISRKSKTKNLFGFIKQGLYPSAQVKIYINHSQLDRIIVNNEASIISVDYKQQVQYQANNYNQEDEVDDSRFKFASLTDLKQQFVKSLIQHTIFRLYSSVSLRNQ